MFDGTFGSETCCIALKPPKGESRRRDEKETPRSITFLIETAISNARNDPCEYRGSKRKSSSRKGVRVEEREANVNIYAYILYYYIYAYIYVYIYMHIKRGKTDEKVKKSGKERETKRK